MKTSNDRTIALSRFMTENYHDSVNAASIIKPMAIRIY